MRAAEKKTKQENFLKAYADCCSVRRACQTAGVARSTVYNWQETDKAFAQQFAEATEDSNDLIDDEIVRRAVHGYEEPVVSNGKLIYGEDGRPLTVTKYSDTLMQMLAKSRMPKYRDKQQVDANINHSGSIDSKTIAFDPKSLTDDELKAMKDVLLRAAQREHE
jgi:hypothetical protein